MRKFSRSEAYDRRGRAGSENMFSLVPSMKARDGTVPREMPRRRHTAEIHYAGVFPILTAVVHHDWGNFLSEPRFSAEALVLGKRVH